MLTASGWSKGSCCLPLSPTPSWASPGRRRRRRRGSGSRRTPPLTQHLQACCRMAAGRKAKPRLRVKAPSGHPSLRNFTQARSSLASKRGVALTWWLVWPSQTVRMERGVYRRCRRARPPLEPVRRKERQKAGEPSAATLAASCKQVQMQHWPVLESGWGQGHRPELTHPPCGPVLCPPPVNTQPFRPARLGLPPPASANVAATSLG